MSNPSDPAKNLNAYYEELKRSLPPHDGIDRDDDWLKDELMQAHALYTRDRSYALDGVRRALDTAIGYFEETMDCHPEEIAVRLWPLRRLSQGLETVDRGYADPLFEPAPRGPGRPPLDITGVEFRFLVGLAVRDAARQNEIMSACTSVAQELNRLGFKRRLCSPLMLNRSDTRPEGSASGDCGSRLPTFATSSIA